MQQVTPDAADKTILALALDHHLVTRLTSLVAVDETPARPEGAPLKLADLPLNLPAGWDFAKVFGEQPKPLAPPSERRAEAGDGRVQLAMNRHPAVVAPASPLVLPKTATDAELKMMVGAVLLMLAMLLIVIPRRRLVVR